MMFNSFLQVIRESCKRRCRVVAIEEWVCDVEEICNK
jgi:hypothetical protein